MDGVKVPSDLLLGRESLEKPTKRSAKCDWTQFLRVQLLIKPFFLGVWWNSFASNCVYSGLCRCHFEKEHWSRMSQTIMFHLFIIICILLYRYHVPVAAYYPDLLINIRINHVYVYTYVVYMHI